MRACALLPIHILRYASVLGLSVLAACAPAAQAPALPEPPPADPPPAGASDPAPATQAPSAAPSGGGRAQPSGDLEISAKHSGKCLEVAGASQEEDGVIIQFRCGAREGDNDHQLWRLVPAGDDHYLLVVKHSGKCLDVYQARPGDGGEIVQHRCKTPSEGNDSQSWRLVPAGEGQVQIVARHSGRCLDVAFGAKGDGSRLIQYRCRSEKDARDNQTWQVRPIAGKPAPARGARPR